VSKKRKRFTVVGGLLVALLIAGGIVAVASPTPKRGEYPVTAQRNFLAGCEEGGQPAPALCHCLLAKEEANYSLADIKSIEAELKRGAPVPPRFTKLRHECESEQNPGLTRELDQFSAWAAAWTACATPHGVPLANYRKRLDHALNSTDPKAEQIAANSTASAFTLAAECVGKLPAGMPALVSLNARLVAGGRLFAQAYALIAREVKEVNAGRPSSTFAISQRYLARASRIVDTVYRDSDALKKRLGAS
jgi:hypothetical protein